MKCINCSYELPDNSKFCSQCGTKQPPAPAPEPVPEPVPEVRTKKTCPDCRSVFDSDHVFCDQCGRLLQDQVLEGKELRRFHMMSKYEGEPTVGIAKATGDLIIYDDRVEFKAKMGNALGNAFGAVGMLLASSKAPGLEVYPMQQIRAVRQGRYGGMMPTLILDLADGKTFSFCGMKGSTAMSEAAGLIENYRNLNQ